MYNVRSYWARYSRFFVYSRNETNPIGRQRHWTGDVYSLQDNIGVGTSADYYSATGVSSLREVSLDTRTAAHEILHILSSTSIASKLYNTVQRESV